MMVVDSISQRFNAAWSTQKSWQAEVATATTTITVRRKRPATPKKRLPPAANIHKPTPDTTAPSDAATTTDEKEVVPAVRRMDERETVVIDLKLTLLKPLRLMNISGPSVSQAAKDLGIPVSDILVVHDDMERDIGKLSFKNEGSANGHNGIKSCIKHLGTQHFQRLRVGIGRPNSKDRSPDFIAKYVLGRFKPFEIQQLEELVYDKAGDEIIRVSTYPPVPRFIYSKKNGE
ncbi:peptidyl-tRNA hydrolase protein 1 [Dissophora ornata]|nr:peptidyl-tRNA hydrolase protein 1 [Dissophora ornata]